jgi:hypothetical protein
VHMSLKCAWQISFHPREKATEPNDCAEIVSMRSWMPAEGRLLPVRSSSVAVNSIAP